jgi:hypothetical protein
MIEDEEFSVSSIWHVSGKKTVSLCPSGNGPAAREWSGKKPAHLYTAQAWSSGSQA